jgi:hypothetical protein
MAGKFQKNENSAKLQSLRASLLELRELGHG